MKISPSILASDFGKLGAEVEAMYRAGADMLHLDIMDGHFVPNISFGPPVVRSLRPVCDIPFDVHLMITNPLEYAPAFIKAGADIITFHVECDSDIEKTLRLIRGEGVRAGLVLKPKTPAQAVFPYLELVDMLLVMTVEPGFGGQSFMPEQMDKLSRLRKAIEESGREIDLQVDGGIDTATAPLAAKNGANVLVAGSALFREKDYGKAVADLRGAALAAIQPK